MELVCTLVIMHIVYRNTAEELQLLTDGLDLNISLQTLSKVSLVRAWNAHSFLFLSLQPSFGEKKSLIPNFSELFRFFWGSCWIYILLVSAYM